MTSKKINVYLPVEVALRELYPKAFLAAFLVMKGYRVFVTPDYMLPNLRFPSGIVLGKNHIHAKKWVDRQGVKLSFILFEEEGAPAFGDAAHRKELIQARLIEGAVDIAKVITTWGKWQTEALREITNIPIVCTGTPYMEICKPKYKMACSDLDKDITKGRSGYLLINTRFAFANGEVAPYAAMRRNSLYYFEGATPGYWRKYFSNDMSMLGAFISMIERVAVTFPDLDIVLRPHPVENCEFYKEIFKDFERITVTNDGHVISWIRNAACILTNACTTSIQTEICEKPVINYQPSYISNEPTLLDGIGLCVHNENDVILAINNILQNNSEIFNVGGWVDELETFYRGDDCFEKFGEIVDSVSINHVPTNFTFKKFTLSNYAYQIKNTIKLILKKNIGHKEFESFEKYFNAAATHFGVNASISKTVGNCYCVENKN